MAINELLLIFARSIFAKAEALKRPEFQELKSRVRKWISEDIRNCGGIIFSEHGKPPEVSKDAAEEAGRMPKPVNLREQNWHSQPKFDPGRRTFQWEHVNTVKSIQEACAAAESEEAIMQILKSRLQIAWILKREDKKLTQLHYRSIRPDGETAYGHAGIELRVKEDDSAD